MKTQGPSSCLSATFSSCCNYFFPGGLALCNHEPGLGGPDAAQSGVGLHVLSVELVFYQLLRLGCRGPTFPYPRAMVWTIIFEKMRLIPPFQRQRRGVGSWAARDALQKTRWASLWTEERHNECCTPLGSKPKGRMGSKCLIFHFANKPGRPQHNTQHNGIS